MKTLFDTLSNAISHHQKRLTLDETITSNDVQLAISQIMAQRSDLFSYEGKYLFDEATHSLQFYYTVGLRQCVAMREEIDNTLANLGFDFREISLADDFETAMYIYKWCFVHYDPLAPSSRPPFQEDEPRIYQIVQRRIFSQRDIALLVQYLFARKKITSIIVSGNIAGCPEVQSWNIVFLEGQPYHFDAAKSSVYWPAQYGLQFHVNENVVDDVNYGFFCISDSQLRSLYSDVLQPNGIVCNQVLPSEQLKKLVDSVKKDLLFLEKEIPERVGAKAQMNEVTRSCCCDSSAIQEDRSMAKAKKSRMFFKQIKPSFCFDEPSASVESPVTYEPSIYSEVHESEVGIDAADHTFAQSLPTSFPSGEGMFSRISSFFRREKNTLHTVYCSVYAPTEVIPGKYFLIDYFLHQASEAHEVSTWAKEAQPDAERRYYTPLSTKLKKGDKVTIICQLYDEHSELFTTQRSVVWEGRMARINLSYHLAESHSQGEICCKSYLSVNGAVVGEMNFLIKIGTRSLHTYAKVDARQFHKVFISYAFKDIEKVRLIAAAYNNLGILHFFDRRDLRAGDVYEEEIYHHIDTADLFLLCWTKNAAESENVQKERHRAMQHAYPQVPMDKATLVISTVSFQPHSPLPDDMRGIYHFEEIG